MTLFYCFGVSGEYFVCDFQESPTGELVDYGFSLGAESSEQESSEEKTSDHQLQLDPDLETDLDAQSGEAFCVSEETNGKNLEEGEFIKIIKCYTDYS